MAKLKPEMLQGNKYTEEVVVKLPSGEEAEIEIRGLKHLEASKIQGILSRAVKVDGKGNAKDIDTAVLTQSRYEALLKSCAMGTVDEDWTEQSINDYWTTEMIEKVGDRVMMISGIGNPEDVESFRNK